MISTQLAYQLTTLRLRATRAQLLLDLASKSDDGDIGDLLKFERALHERVCRRQATQGGARGRGRAGLTPSHRTH